MAYARARARYLAAMGIAAAPALLACKGADSTSPDTPIAADASAGIPTAASSAVVTPPPATAATTTGTSATPTGTTAPPPTMHHPMFPPCPHGNFCVAEPASVPKGGGAPAPYGRCPATAKDPAASSELGPSRSVSFDETGTPAARASDPKACCYRWVTPCAGGRALRASVEDAPRTTPVGRARGWETTLAPAPVPESEREALAAHWAREAAGEHASVASFARATLDLLAVGAPADLVAGVQAAALDEVEHARIAFSMASAYAGAPLGPGPLAPLPPAEGAPTLASVARSTLLDACAGETVAALAAREASGLADDPVVATALDRIAEDEERHAELAWRTVAWALRSGGQPVREALEAAALALRDALDEPAPAGRDEDLARHGVLASAQLHALRVRALREVVLTCIQGLLLGCA